MSNKIPENETFKIISTERKGNKLIYDGFIYHLYYENCSEQYWRCITVFSGIYPAPGV
jgi:hypothetical protein